MIFLFIHLFSLVSDWKVSTSILNGKNYYDLLYEKNVPASNSRHLSKSAERIYSIAH